MVFNSHQLNVNLTIQHQTIISFRERHMIVYVGYNFLFLFLVLAAVSLFA